MLNVVAVAVFSIVYMASNLPLAESWWPGSTGVVDFSQGTRKLRAGAQVSLVLGLRFPSRAAQFRQLLLANRSSSQTTDTATFLLTVRLLQDQYSHVLLKPFNKEGP
jgi:hypothetical protein